MNNRTRQRLAMVLGALLLAFGGYVLFSAFLPTSRSARVEPAPAPLAVCDHPFIPHRVGARRHYSYAVAGLLAEVDIQLIDSEPRAEWVELRWKQTIGFRGMPPYDVDLPVRCTPGEGAQDPWTLVNTGVPGIGIVERDWLWPEQLRAGQTFDGAMTIEALGHRARVQRRSRVIQFERVTVTAGTFDTWRVEVAESQDAGTSNSTFWIAENIGLVKSEQMFADAPVRIELTSFEDPPAQ